MTQLTEHAIDNWIGGGPRGTKEHLDNIDPARNRVICRIPRSRKDDVDAATAIVTSQR